jgi:hypothetical protein
MLLFVNVEFNMFLSKINLKEMIKNKNKKKLIALIDCLEKVDLQIGQSISKI